MCLGEPTNCKFGKDFKKIYTLNRARVAFSLGYFDTTDRFIRFKHTTVVSNEIVESK